MRVEVLTDADWRAWRDLRLEALADTPIGFGELHADAVLRSDEEWEERINHPPNPGVRVMAFDGDEAVGMAGGFVSDAGLPILFAVYVRPAARGGEVLRLLVDEVAAWAAPAPLTLDVHVDNERARRAYLTLGFVLTGETTPGGGIDGRDLHRMRR
ncbi:MAG TPA: GNAT family N-acetyltransferase [Mycobacteriales bacterium]|nr:GNAT family N-acetyltransferase [Mycobacteriales bacterium]